MLLSRLAYPAALVAFFIALGAKLWPDDTPPATPSAFTPPPSRPGGEPQALKPANSQASARPHTGLWDINSSGALREYLGQKGKANGGHLQALLAEPRLGNFIDNLGNLADGLAAERLDALVDAFEHQFGNTAGDYHYGCAADLCALVFTSYSETDKKAVTALGGNGSEAHVALKAPKDGLQQVRALFLY